MIVEQRMHFTDVSIITVDIRDTMVLVLKYFSTGCNVLYLVFKSNIR